MSKKRANFRICLEEFFRVFAYSAFSAPYFTRICSEEPLLEGIFQRFASKFSEFLSNGCWKSDSDKSDDNGKRFCCDYEELFLNYFGKQRM
ncbi:unnamed protein product [Caenorhabditis brenneri]